MRQQISFLTQSRFYSPAFNAAIFDGPVRIYFAQYQESLALKIYFMAQERMKDLYVQARDAFRRTGINIFVMLYPSSEAFEMSFDENPTASTVLVERLGHDFVMGVRGPIADEDVELICSRIEEIVKALTEVNLPEPLQQTADEAVF
jgi:hypothetical protein